MPSEDYMEDARDERDDICDADEDLDLVDETDTDSDESADETVTFASLGLPEEILAAVTDMGFRVPTPIQAAAIPPLLELRDVVRRRARPVLFFLRGVHPVNSSAGWELRGGWKR